MDDEGDDNLCFDTDSDLVENKDGTRCQVKWTQEEEDEKIVELVAKYGTKHWTLISKHLKGRLGKQCRDRWHNHLDPMINKSCWTDEEDLKRFRNS
uniref:Uncharacterized protein n=1 Tax=Oreochromis aureus TaxID=47969 RepID=A0AAZ1XC08_OREAU